jgi:hypothetical protein
MCVNRVRGVNFPLLTLYVYNDIIIDYIPFNNININCFKIYKNLYKVNLDYNYVYCDLDDTLIINNKINVDLIKYLYMCINNNKKIILITRNQSPEILLNKFKININIFEEIIVVSEVKNILKSNYIKHMDSIFIDDSFFERNDVRNNKNINCFSLAELELLI